MWNVYSKIDKIACGRIWTYDVRSCLRNEENMAGNANLHASRAARVNEYYTQLSTIEDELQYYRSYFKGKVVFCNCDDPAYGDDGQDHFGDGQGGYTSNFFRYFQLNFKQLGLKKLIATHYDPEKPTYKLEIVGDQDGDGQITNMDIVKTDLNGNGDFRSPECLELLNECDIVATNPPFSLMNEYLPTLVKSGKQFLVLGNINHAFYKEIFPYILDGIVWLGRNNGHFWFRVPDYFEPKKTDYKEDADGQKWRRLGNICWFTNLDIPSRHEPLDLYKLYTPEEFPKYDTYDAIHCKRYDQIPKDYYGIIAAPITYLAHHCPEQFEIVGEFKHGIDGPFDLAVPKLDGGDKYTRVAIRRIKKDEE